jgi:hypothetical protein
MLRAFAAIRSTSESVGTLGEYSIKRDSRAIARNCSLSFMFNTSTVCGDPTELLGASQLCEGAVHGLLGGGLALAGYASHLREGTILYDAEVDRQALGGAEGFEQLGQVRRVLRVRCALSGATELRKQREPP